MYYGIDNLMVVLSIMIHCQQSPGNIVGHTCVQHVSVYTCVYIEFTDNSCDKY